jgi:hypothetical protein
VRQGVPLHNTQRFATRINDSGAITPARLNSAERHFEVRFSEHWLTSGCDSH